MWGVADMKISKELKPFNGTDGMYRTWAQRVKDHFTEKNPDWYYVFAEIEKQKGEPLTDLDKEHLARRANSAKYWVDHLADDADKTQLQTSLPASSAELTVLQRAFITRLRAVLDSAAWSSPSLQTLLFEVSRATPIRQGDAFQSLYRIFLDRTSGPRAGNLLAFLDRDFVLERCSEISVDTAAFWQASATDATTLSVWLTKQKTDISAATSTTQWDADSATGCLELTILDAKEKPHLHRFLLEASDEASCASAAESLLASLA